MYTLVSLVLLLRSTTPRASHYISSLNFSHKFSNYTVYKQQVSVTLQYGFNESRYIKNESNIKNNIFELIGASKKLLSLFLSQYNEDSVGQSPCQH